MKNSMGLIAAFLGGAIVGGALGLLFAPESGDETRKKIVDALEKRGIKLNKDDMEDLVDEIKSQVIAEEKWFIKFVMQWLIIKNQLKIFSNFMMK